MIVLIHAWGITAAPLASVARLPTHCTQTEIRDYNQQMEQKVNILMHILQTSTAPATTSSTQLQQQLSLTQPAPSTSTMAASQPMSHAGMLPNCSNGCGSAGLSTGLLNQLSNNSAMGAACASANAMSSANLLQQARKDALLGSLGQQVRSPDVAVPRPVVCTP